jgi:hypothetical protein
MTDLEFKAINATKEVWNAFLLLPVVHPDDQNDFRHHVHALQNIILSREGLRTLKAIESSNSADNLKDIPVPSYIEGGIVKGNLNAFL